MAGGPTTPELVAAVGEAGGLGLLAGGYLTAPQLAAAIAEVWDASSRPFGVNLFVPAQANAYAVGPGELTGADRADAVAAYRAALMDDAEVLGVQPGEARPGDDDDWERKLDLVVRERVPLVSFTFGLPSGAVLGELRRAGIETVATVTDVDEAAAALGAGVDGLCLQGPDGGGHRGTLDPVKEPSSADLRRPRHRRPVAHGRADRRRGRHLHAGAGRAGARGRGRRRPDRDRPAADSRGGDGPGLSACARGSRVRAHRGDAGLLRPTRSRPRDRLHAPARRQRPRRLPGGPPRHGAAATGVRPGGASPTCSRCGPERAGGRRGRSRPPRSWPSSRTERAGHPRAADSWADLATRADSRARWAGTRHTLWPCPVPKET